jgi:hypothetical protein
MAEMNETEIPLDVNNTERSDLTKVEHLSEDNDKDSTTIVHQLPKGKSNSKVDQSPKHSNIHSEDSPEDQNWIPQIHEQNPEVHPQF